METEADSYEQALMSLAETASSTYALAAEYLAERYGYENFDIEDFKRKLSQQHPEIADPDAEESAEQVINYLAYMTLDSLRPNLMHFQPMAFSIRVVREHWPYEITETQRRIGIEDERRLRMEITPTPDS